MDILKYFHPEHQPFLEYVNFETSRGSPGARRLGCKDTIVARVSAPSGVKLTFNRALSFEPDGPFYLSVTFSCFLRFREETFGDVDWKTVDIAGDFRAGGGAVINSLAARASLLIAEITSASGRPPLITSAVIDPKQDK